MRLAPTAVLAALVAPFAASASVATTADGPLRYTAAPGEINNVTLARVTGDTFRVADVGATIQAGTGCTQESPNVVACTTAAGRSLIARLGDQDDIAVSRTSRSAQLFGEAGSDRLTGASGRDTLLGGDGSDTLSGGSSPDTLDGGIGDDALAGGSSGDRLRGGAGRDALDGGTSGDSLGGGSGDDILHGGSGDDAMSGGSEDDIFAEDAAANGSDRIYGDTGFDTADYGARTGNLLVDLNSVRDDGDLRAGERDDVRTDRVVSGSGKDQLFGDEHGGDTLASGAGDDFVDGRRGADNVDAGPGLDQIAARDLSGDTITCGEGPDSVAADRLDNTAPDCEKVRREASMTLALAARAAYPTVLLRLSCPRTAFKACGGRVIVRTLKRVRTREGARILTVGVRRFAVPAGSERIIGMRIRAAARPFLGRDGLVVRAALSGFDGAGPARRDAIRFRLLRR
jgi:Ca2+-binding RTX toxin-like protein